MSVASHPPQPPRPTQGRAPGSAATPADGRLVSLVVAVFYEEECIDEFVDQVTAVLDGLGTPWELVFVDDGSTDRTVEKIVERIERDPRVRLIELSRNHGKAFALTAGLAHARGSHVVCMDPDLQDPPEYIQRFTAKLDEGWDLVFGVRHEKQDSFLNRLFSRVFWFTLRRLTGLDLPVGLSTMRSMNRDFVDRFLEYGETNRFLEGMLMDVGLRRTQIDVPHRPRFAGKTKFNMRRKMKLAFDAICDFSDLPLRVASRVGVALTAIGLLSVVVVVVLRLFVMEFQLGWPSLFCLIVVGFGLNLFFLGVLGRYVGGIYREVKRRPIYSVRCRHNVAHETTGTRAENVHAGVSR